MTDTVSADCVTITTTDGSSWVGEPTFPGGSIPWDIYPNPCVPFVQPNVIIFPVVRPRATVRRPKKLKKRAPVRRHNMAKKTGKKETFITLVLDRSYSMEHIRQTALDSLNEQIGSIKKHAKKGGKTFVSLILFDDTIDVLYENVPVADVVPLELKDYELGGCTALRDAMLTAIETMESKQNSKKNQGFLTVLISDGQENASGTTPDQLKSRIEELEGTDNWTFTYMLDGHNWEQATQFAFDSGINSGNVSVFTSTISGTQAMGAVVNNSLASYMSDRSVGITKKLDFYNDGSGDESRVAE